MKAGFWTPLSLRDAVDVLFIENLFKVRRIFVSKLSKGLKLAMASLVALFKPIHQKFGTRRIYEMNEV